MAQENNTKKESNLPDGGITRPVNVKDTQPIPVKARKTKRWRSILLGILLVILMGSAGGGIGYWKGIQDRLTKQNEQLLTEAALQFQYGLQQMANGNYNLAKTHFEYVIKIYPDFPELTNRYTEVLVKLAESNAPTAQPLPTATLSNLNAEALFNQAVQEVQTLQWAAALNSLEALRNEDTTYRTLEVDGLYFLTMRYRAVDMIKAEGNLEEGLYLFSLVNRYAPLDHDAVNYASWARLYLTGASYWDVDWEQVVNYFSQLAAAFPYMHDGNGWTANDRLVKGTEYYADQLAENGEHCDAVDYYQTAINFNPTEELQDKYIRSYLKCYPPTAIPQPTPTADLLIPTDEPVIIDPVDPDPLATVTPQ